MLSARYILGITFIVLTLYFVFTSPVLAQWRYDAHAPIMSVSLSGTGCTTSGNTTTCNQTTAVDISVTCQDSGPNESGCSYIDINGGIIGVSGTSPFTDPKDITRMKTFNLSCGETVPYAIYIQDYAGNFSQITHTVRVDCTVFTVSCSVNPAVANTGEAVTWNAEPNPATGTYSYLWSGILAPQTSKTVVGTAGTPGNYSTTVRATKSGASVTSPACNVCIRQNTSSCPTYRGYPGGVIADGCGGTVTCPGQRPADFTCNGPVPACVGDRNNTPVVNLNWSSSFGANYYLIYRSLNYRGISYSTTYQDTPVVRNTSYGYRVDSCNDWGCASAVCPQTTTPWCDFDPPKTNSSLYTPILETCYSSASWGPINPLQATVVDEPPSPPFGNSGIRSVQFRMRNNDTGATSTVRSASFNAGTGRWAANVPFADMVPGIGAYGNRFDILIEATDFANFSSGFQAQGKSFEARSNCADAYLQTSGGSVHSNENIDVPNRNAP